MPDMHCASCLAPNWLCVLHGGILTVCTCAGGGGGGGWQARAQVSHGSQANNVSSVQAIVIEKADKILAEKSRYAGQISGAGTGARGAPSRRKSEPLLDSTHGEGGGVGVVKLDLDKLRSGAGVGGDKSGDTHAWRDGSLRAGSAGDRDAGSRQSELSYVMDVLGTGGKKGERKHSDVRGGSGFANKADRRARVEDLKERLQLVWEALGVAEEQRARFRNMVSGLSSKPEAALQAYEQEYALQMRQVSGAVEVARQGIEAAWQEMDMGRHDAEREEFERKVRGPAPRPGTPVRAHDDERVCLRASRPCVATDADR